jgi:hypothetical protein
MKFLCGCVKFESLKWNWSSQAGGPLNSTGVGLLNHQTSKISTISLLIKIALWVFLIRRYKGGIGNFKLGDPGRPSGQGY